MTLSRNIPRPSGAQTHHNLGNELYDKGDVDGAIAEYREALRLKPGSAGRHYNLGTALEAQGKRQEALEEYRIACQLTSENPDFCGKAKQLSGELR